MKTLGNTAREVPLLTTRKAALAMDELKAGPNNGDRFEQAQAVTVD